VQNLLREACDLCACRSHARDQEEAVAKLKSQLTEVEAKIQQQAREFEAYKNQLHLKPEVQLQTEVNFLKLEKVDWLLVLLYVNNSSLSSNKLYQYN